MGVCVGGGTGKPNKGLSLVPRRTLGKELGRLKSSYKFERASPTQHHRPESQITASSLEATRSRPRHWQGQFLPGP